jgi:hypothetical protein
MANTMKTKKINMKWQCTVHKDDKTLTMSLRMLR